MIFTAGRWPRGSARRRRGRSPAARKGYCGCVEDDDIQILVKRLARAHPSGGTVIERAAIMAEGPHSTSVMTWILAHGATPEVVAARASARRGLHGARVDASGTSEARNPARYVLPAGALD
jgi:hypothetical protein